jgi:charged multivesicular body protein 2A
MASMNRGLNLPGIQKIMNDFERESSMMDMKEEMMSDAVDEVMDDEEDEEEEGDKILREVLDEIGIGLAHEVSLFPGQSTNDFSSVFQQLSDTPTGLGVISAPLVGNRQPVALGETAGIAHPARIDDDKVRGDGMSGGISDEDALQARLDALRRG